MENELIKCTVIVVFYVLVTLFEMLANTSNLGSCAAPLDIWIVMEFFFMVAPLVCMCFFKDFYLQFLIWGNIYLFCLWNLGGWLMYLYVKAETPFCMSESLKFKLNWVLCLMGVLGGVFFIYFTWIGGSAVFNKIFHGGHDGEVYQVYRALEGNNDT